MGEWKVSSSPYKDEMVYQVYRLKDKNAADRIGNREYKGGLFKSKKGAQILADSLNTCR
ncbi:hypothetical protein TAMA11512_13040 [Selenomonas sp. TAMA-11512]|uniref:hypothetical protein n=1 Tax=Selenomonas sp. TAMA-11512 TaxID=3095337 RepID=UPI003088C415|nr:hypothetical protein TAMA11512_13040 [Selenomonas sp. TAMA-11512]